MRCIFLLLAAGLVIAAPHSLAKASFPDTLSLPNGFRPEGIAIQGNTFYVGSIPNGAIYAGDLRTGSQKFLIPGADGRAASGLDLRQRRRGDEEGCVLHRLEPSLHLQARAREEARARRDGAGNRAH